MTAHRLGDPVEPRLRPWDNGYLTVVDPAERIRTCSCGADYDPDAVTPHRCEPVRCDARPRRVFRNHYGWCHATVCRCGWERYAGSRREAQALADQHNRGES